MCIVYMQYSLPYRNRVSALQLKYLVVDLLPCSEVGTRYTDGLLMLEIHMYDVRSIVHRDAASDMWGSS